MLSGQPRLRVEQIELNLFAIVPRRAHERIVPLLSDKRKYPSRLASWPVVVPNGFRCIRDVPVSPTAVTSGFKFL
jgi:hypothetical protein